MCPATHAAIQSSVAVSSNMCAATHQQHSNTVCVQYHSMYPDKHTYNFGTASPVCNGQLSIEHYMHKPSLSLRLPVDADSKKKKKKKTQKTCVMQEYSSSSNVSEARHCLHKLAVPFFHHEVVKQALLRMMEDEQTQPALVQLLRQLSSSGDLSDSQMSRVRSSSMHIRLCGSFMHSVFRSFLCSSCIQTWHPIASGMYNS